MKLLGKPKNRWGWLRVAGWAALALVLLWTGLAALLRGAGEVAWLLWSGYPAFSLLDGLELAVAPLLAVIAGAWLEDQDHQAAAEQSNHHAAERAAAEQRKQVLKHAEGAVLAELAGARHPRQEDHPSHSQPLGGAGNRPGSQPGEFPLSEEARLRIHAAVQAALAELDGKGKGELLHFLHQHGLVSGDHPALDLRGADLSGLALPKAHLPGLALEGADLSEARLDGAHLSGSRLAGVKLVKAHLRHAHLGGAVLAEGDLSGAHLEGADLDGADLRGARLDGALLMGAKLRRCLLGGIQLKGARLQKADLSGSQGLAPGSEPKALDEAILIDTLLPDGRVLTNARGKEYLQNKEIAALIDRL